MMAYILLTWIGLLGLAIGSFLNVVIYRVPRKMKFMLERSLCPHCQKQLKWWHNIPILSFVILRGKCGFCKEKISWRYPLVEILNAAIFLYFYYQFGLSLEFAIFAILGSSLLAIFFIDLDHQLIPDVITVPVMLIGLGFSMLPHGIGIKASALGLLVGGGALYFVAILGDWLFKKESMGGGDIKMAAMLGAFVGWQKVLLIFITSALIGLFTSVILMLFSSKLRANRVVPFGPFLALAAAVAVIYGDKIISFYINNFLTVH